MSSIAADALVHCPETGNQRHTRTVRLYCGDGQWCWPFRVQSVGRWDTVRLQKLGVCIVLKRNSCITNKVNHEEAG